MDNWEDSFDRLTSQLKVDMQNLLSARPCLMDEADPPSKPGVYMIHDHNQQLAYIGEAKGSGGLRDRLLSKHMSGDDSHAIQRAYKTSYPDRKERREFIRNNVSARWVETVNASSAVALERIAILIFDPPWNRK